METLISRTVSITRGELGRSRLLDLPRELRNLILKHAITAETLPMNYFTEIITTVLLEQGDHRWRPWTTSIDICTKHFDKTRTEIAQSFRALSLVCHQLRAESEHIFFVYNVFEFSVGNKAHAVDLNRRLRSASDSFVQKMRKVRLVYSWPEELSAQITLLDHEPLFEYCYTGAEMELVSYLNTEFLERKAYRRMTAHVKQYRKLKKKYNSANATTSTERQPRFVSRAEEDRCREDTKMDRPIFCFTRDLLRQIFSQVPGHWRCDGLLVPIGYRKEYLRFACRDPSPDYCFCEQHRAMRRNSDYDSNDWSDAYLLKEDPGELEMRKQADRYYDEPFFGDMYID